MSERKTATKPRRKRIAETPESSEPTSTVESAAESVAETVKSGAQAVVDAVTGKGTRKPGGRRGPKKKEGLVSGVVNQAGDVIEAIRRRAYDLWQSEGGQHGRHDYHWAQAEQEITGQGKPAPKPRRKPNRPRS